MKGDTAAVKEREVGLREKRDLQRRESGTGGGGSLVGGSRASQSSAHSEAGGRGLKKIN